MSSLKVNQILNTSNVEQYLCKAWVNFNGTGTVAIRASGNVSSITDNATGLYTVNFTNAMTDANFSAVASKLVMSSWTGGIETRNYATGSVGVQVYEGGANVDSSFISVAVFR